MRSLLAHPELVWLVLLAALSTVVRWPPRDWRGVVVDASWLCCAAVVLLRVILR
jgi:hypothetical protein